MTRHVDTIIIFTDKLSDYQLICSTGVGYLLSSDSADYWCKTEGDYSLPSLRITTHDHPPTVDMSSLNNLRTNHITHVIKK